MRTLEYPVDIETEYSLPRGSSHLKPDSLDFSPPPVAEITERQLEVEGRTVVQKNLIAASAALSNPTDKPVKVDFWLGTFDLKLLEDGAIRSKPRDPNMPPMPPPAPPPPFRITVPARTTVKFTDWVYLDEYVYEGSPVAQVEWSMRFADGPQPSGRFSVTLPRRGSSGP